MARLPRAVAKGIPHHIIHRGNNRQEVFFVDDDRRFYLDLLKKQSDKYGLIVIGYCLMSNHIHLVAVPQNDDSLAKAVGRTAFIYTQYINRFHKRCGHLWQGRFYSCALDESHFWTAMRYIECNPVRARMCHKPWKYNFSSAAAHIDKTCKSELLDLKKWYETTDPDEWQKLLLERLDDGKIKRLRYSTQRGRPLGSDSFISKLESVIGRRLRPLPVGRPKKKKINVKTHRKAKRRNNPK